MNPNSDPDSTSPATMTPMITPAITSSPVSGASWCIASPSASPTALQVALDYACGYGGADCSAIQSGGSCYNPNTLRDHASFAFNSYYQKDPIPSSCNFGGTAVTTNSDPSEFCNIFFNQSINFKYSTNLFSKIYIFLFRQWDMSVSID